MIDDFLGGQFLRKWCLPFFVPLAKFWNATKILFPEGMTSIIYKKIELKKTMTNYSHTVAGLP